MAREKQPNRRPTITHDLEFGGDRYHVSIGYTLSAEPKEVFIRGAKTGSHLDELLDDAAVCISIALQNGVNAAELRRSLGDSIVSRVVGLLDGPPQLS